MKTEGWVGGSCFLLPLLFLFLVHDVCGCVCLCLCSCLLSLPPVQCLCLLVRARQDKARRHPRSSRGLELSTPQNPRTRLAENRDRIRKVLCYLFLPSGSSVRDCSCTQQMAGPCWSRWDGMGYWPEQGRQGPRASFLGTIVTPPKFSSTPPRTSPRQLSHLRSSPISC